MTRNGIRVSSDIFIPETAIQETFIRASGPGGQNVNKVATAVQLRFDPADVDDISAAVRTRVLKLAGSRATRDGHVLIEADRFRTQERNRDDARNRLADLVRRAAEPPPPPRKKTRPTRASVERRLKSKAGRSRLKKMRGRVEPD